MLPAFGIFHITIRGVDRCLIFRDEDDYRFLLVLFRRLIAEHALQAHAYCFMPNHVHAVVEGPMEAISRAFHRINGIHAQRFNERYGRTGHLFQDRFGSKVIEDDEHLANACEYVWDNPVRAGLCKTRSEWRWSGRLPHREPGRVRSGHGRGQSPVGARGAVV
jgi:REP element-mobilizing transposase RayT